MAGPSTLGRSPRSAVWITKKTEPKSFFEKLLRPLSSIFDCNRLLTSPHVQSFPTACPLARRSIIDWSTSSVTSKAMRLPSPVTPITSGGSLVRGFGISFVIKWRPSSCWIASKRSFTTCNSFSGLLIPSQYPACRPFFFRYSMTAGSTAAILSELFITRICPTHCDSLRFSVNHWSQMNFGARTPRRGDAKQPTRNPSPVAARRPRRAAASAGRNRRCPNPNRWRARELMRPIFAPWRRILHVLDCAGRAQRRRRFRMA